MSLVSAFKSIIYGIGVALVTTCSTAVELVTTNATVVINNKFMIYMGNSVLNFPYLS